MSCEQISNARSPPLHCTHQSDSHVTDIDQVQFTIQISWNFALTECHRKTGWRRLIPVPRPDRQCWTTYNDWGASFGKLERSLFGLKFAQAIRSDHVLFAQADGLNGSTAELVRGKNTFGAYVEHSTHAAVECGSHDIESTFMIDFVKFTTIASPKVWISR